MKRVAIAIPLILSLPACNTVVGMGKDLQAVGDEVAEAAVDARARMFGPRETQTGTARAGIPCDPNPDLDGSSGLPPCVPIERK